MCKILKLSPVVLFVYNRPWHTKQTIEALRENELSSDSELFIYSDAAKNGMERNNVTEVRELIKNVSGFKAVTVIERDNNWGLANSVIDGVTAIINKYGRAIVLEDDLITSPHFLKFMNEALDFYSDNPKVFSISGFSFSRKFMRFYSDNTFDIYAHYRPMSWGWATWENRWGTVDWSVADYESFMTDRVKQKKFELGGTDLTTMLKEQMEGQVDSWYIRWSYACYKQRLLNIYPRIPLVNNIGHDGTGVHKSNENENIFSHNDLLAEQKWRFIEKPVVKSKLANRFNESFNPTIMTKLKRKLSKIGIKSV